MEALDHDIKFEGGPKDHTHIIKGKRTKRQRPQSPIPFTIAATHSSSGNNTISSPATSNDFPTGSAATEEDEDTALCLILLSKGFSQQPPKVENDEFALYKFNSKRYLQAPTTTASGKAGIYVYECKTCSRTFPSFQALGGHRASHKKPKTTIVVEQKKKPSMVLFDDEEQPPPAPSPPPPQESIKRNSSSSSSLSLQLGNRGIFTNPNKSPKFHECSICGAEFNSGQALGGHMRRHRVPGGTTTNSTNPTLSLVPSSQIEIEIEDDKKSRNDGLCLDLNLPAPDDDHHDSKFAFSPKQQQQQKQSALLLSTCPTLVDCHY